MCGRWRNRSVTKHQKKQKINESLSISIGRSGDEVFQRLGIVTWPENFDVLGSTWVVCGSFEVVASPTSSDKVLMCELNQPQYYQYEFTSRIREYREKHTDASIVKALSIVEESFISKAIELTRSGS